MFRDYDDTLLERQQAIYDDEAKLIESAQSALRELESLFDSDMSEAKKEGLQVQPQQLMSYPIGKND
jgi:glutathione-regulated potassium-efflux system protein KefB